MRPQAVLYRPPGGGPLRERSLQQLSGGERRRAALALSLGFADLVRARGRLACNLLVLDEVGVRVWAGVLCRFQWFLFRF